MENTIKHLEREDVAEHKTTDCPRYGRDAQGYGFKIPTAYMVRLVGEKLWRRVYACCYSNNGTAYIVRNGEDIVLNFDNF